jgi:hypothetical protein
LIDLLIDVFDSSLQPDLYLAEGVLEPLRDLPVQLDHKGTQVIKVIQLLIPLELHRALGIVYTELGGPVYNGLELRTSTSYSLPASHALLQAHNIGSQVVL